VSVDGAGFPTRLRTLPDPPEGLYLRTKLATEILTERVWSRPGVAIVGARAASSSGLAFARELAWDLARRGIVIISGLARGIDGAAHEGALLAEGVTVGVLGCGIDDCYPPEHAALAGRVEASGVLLSEWPGRTPALPFRFPRRNRLVSGLCDVLILVEGELNSGTRHTVAFALQQGREVMAVPRDPHLPGSLAPNRLIRDGAAPVLGAEDVVAVLAARAAAGGGTAASDRAPALSVAAGSSRQATDETPSALRRRVERRVAHAAGLTPEQLAERLPGIDAAALQAELLTLEIEGRLARDGAGRLRPAAQV
jgi:DNA processing protein